MFKINIKTIILSAILLFTLKPFAMETPVITKINCQTIGNREQCKFNSGSIVIYRITNMPYALCAQAKCKIDTNNPKVAACQCPIYGLNDQDPEWKSISLSDKPIDQVKPMYDGKKLTEVTSNFSLAMSDSPITIDVNHTKCISAKPMPWANCYGVRCNVTYTEKNGKMEAQANCQCPVSSSLTYLSSGPQNTDECQLDQEQIWSAADDESAALEFELISQSYEKYQDTIKQSEKSGE